MSNVQTFLKNWGVPIATALIVSTTSWVRVEIAATDAKRKLEELGNRIDRVTAIGSDGFLDPQIHLGVDTHIHCESRDFLRISEWKRWHDSFFQLNETLKRPKGE
jgi:hypothetical protein